MNFGFKLWTFSLRLGLSQYRQLIKSKIGYEKVVLMSTSILKLQIKSNVLVQLEIKVQVLVVHSSYGCAIFDIIVKWAFLVIYNCKYFMGYY